MTDFPLDRPQRAHRVAGLSVEMLTFPELPRTLAEPLSGSDPRRLADRR